MPQLARGRTVLAVVAASLLLVACGDDDDEGSTDTTSSETSSTTSTQPPADDLDEVRPIVEDLLQRRDDVTTRILGDPAQANDPDAPILDELAAIYTEQTYEDLLGVYRRNAEDELVYTPYNSDRLGATTLDGELEALDENTVEGRICNRYTYRSSSPSGGTTLDGVTHPGLLRVVRVDGQWLIELLGNDDTQVCEPERASA